MSLPIERQSDQFKVFDNGTMWARERHAAVDEAEVADMLRGPGIHASLLDTRRVAVDTRGMDPDSHAYHTEDSFSPYDSQGGARHWDPNTGYQPSEYDEHQSELVGEDDDSGYNWGPEPGYEPGADPGPHPDFHGDAPHPFGTPIYHPGGGEGYDPRIGRASFSPARPGIAGDGLTREALAVPSAQP